MHHQPVITELPAMQTISVAGRCEITAIGPKIGELYGKMGPYFGANGLQMTGAPLCFYHSYDATHTDLEAGFQVDKPGSADDTIQNKAFPAQKYVFVDYYGPYENIKEGWDALFAYLKAEGIKSTGAPFEMYYTDPGTEPDSAKWRTGIYCPI